MKWGKFHCFLSGVYMNYVFLAVEWSCYESFKPAAGELVIEDPQCCQCVIANLAQGNMYFVRVYAWNIRGWSKAALSSPTGVIPTCNYTAKSCKVCWCHAHVLTSSLFVHFTAWREVDDVTSRTEGTLSTLSQLFTNVKNSRHPEAATIKGN